MKACFDGQKISLEDQWIETIALEVWLGIPAQKVATNFDWTIEAVRFACYTFYRFQDIHFDPSWGKKCRLRWKEWAKEWADTDPPCGPKPKKERSVSGSYDPIVDARKTMFELDRGSYGTEAEAAIRKARAWYPGMDDEEFVEFIVDSIKGARMNPWFCGHNGAGKVYDSWGNLLGNASRITQHTEHYRMAKANKSFVRPKLNRSGKRKLTASEATTEMFDSPETVFNDPMKIRRLEVLSSMIPSQQKQLGQ
jgi:hypothetical protein